MDYWTYFAKGKHKQMNSTELEQRYLRNLKTHEPVPDKYQDLKQYTVDEIMENPNKYGLGYPGFMRDFMHPVKDWLSEKHLWDSRFDKYKIDPKNPILQDFLIVCEVLRNDDYQSNDYFLDVVWEHSGSKGVEAFERTLDNPSLEAAKARVQEEYQTGNIAPALENLNTVLELI